MITGGCLCGAVTYEISTPLPGAGNCHCSICRRGHGAAFATWTFVDPGDFRWTAGEESIASYATSPGQTRLFCRNCGSPLAASHGADVSEVVLASVHGDPEVRPGEHIFVGSKANWHEITDDLPRHEAWPPGIAA